ncbi:hypothetical protein L0668_15605 [Paraglaciecola aquimarina]|uniref:DUF4180 domain-containing protein n=1 Tax=Paraglaciecola algarum TaxID=3050085 RepID=A0ABS9D9B0_9ALTE|nr:hypothetical protein [Paraglaciecola sp. G1-23]MCF2949546.1 hypothetical protein [Paraglaciecola sp. G1-23]
MRFYVNTLDDISCITIDGTLNALDMIFMMQSAEFKTAITSNNKLLFDYSAVDGTNMSAEDVFGVAMLGKRSLENSGNTHLAIVVDDLARRDMEKISKAIFSNTQSEIFVSDDKNQAIQILKST